jgi:hypothetical protein
MDVGVSFFLPPFIMFDPSHYPILPQLAGLLAIDKVFGTGPERCPKAERAVFAHGMLVHHKYQQCSRSERGMICHYLRAVTGYSSSQLSRYIQAYKNGKKLCLPYSRHRFTTRFTNMDRELLAETDNLHGRLNGPATRKICAQMVSCRDFRFSRLATISVSHLYALRRGDRYRDCALTFEKTKPTQILIGERCKPEPEGKPGYLRVDTVHQGDKNKAKGVYHINFVDEVTQWQVVLAVEEISEKFLLPVLREALRLFPFRILNFHSDNGSEFINREVAKLLQKLLIHQTKSGPRHSNDNGLVETKNGAIIRKHLGYIHIPGKWASRINTFYREHLIPYLNFHRPCAFATRTQLPNGKIEITYHTKNYRTPLEQLLSQKEAETYLCRSMTIEKLQQLAQAKNPNQAVRDMQEAKRKLLDLILKHLNNTPEAPLHS